MTKLIKNMESCKFYSSRWIAIGSSAYGGYGAGVEAGGEKCEAVGRGRGGEAEAWREIFFIGRSPESYAVVDVIPCQYPIGLVLPGIMQ